MANEEREFSFSTRKVQVGGRPIALGTADRPAEMADLETTTNVVFENGAVEPDFVTVPESTIVRNPLSEGSGTTAADSIGTNDLSLNGPTWKSGAGNGGNYLQFAGTDTQASWNSVPRSGSQDRTLALWVNPNSLDSNRTYATLGTNSNGEKWTFKVGKNGNGNLRIEIAGTGYTSSLTLSTGAWQAIGVSLSGSTLGDHLLYLDGETEAASGSATVNTGTSKQELGYTPFFSGRGADAGIDDPVWADTGWDKSQFDQWREATVGNYS